MEKGGRKPALRAVCKEELAGWLAEIHMEANTARARPGRGPLTPERTVQCRTGPSKRKQPLPNIRTHATLFPVAGSADKLHRRSLKENI